MFQRLIDRLAPDAETLRKHRFLRLFQHRLQDPNLWHLNRYSVSSAVFIGFFVAFTPLPIHMVTAALVAIMWRANVPVALSAVWLSNPLTIPPQFYFAYKIGARILHQPQNNFAFELSLQWLRNEFNSLWQPLLLGCLICGFAAAALGWAGVRIIWRLQVTARWRARQRLRAQH